MLGGSPHANHIPCNDVLSVVTGVQLIFGQVAVCQSHRLEDTIRGIEAKHSVFVFVSVVRQCAVQGKASRFYPHSASVTL